MLKWIYLAGIRSLLAQRRLRGLLARQTTPVIGAVVCAGLPKQALGKLRNPRCLQSGKLRQKALRRVL